jgi:hypothetical protein
MQSQHINRHSYLKIQYNVFYRHFARYRHFDRLSISVYQVRWQRQRGQKRHISTMWCVSKLDYMIMSLRAKSERNYLQNSSRLRLFRKCTFHVCWSHNQKHMTCLLSEILISTTLLLSEICKLWITWLRNIKVAKVHLRSKRNCDEFWR